MTAMEAFCKQFNSTYICRSSSVYKISWRETQKEVQILIWDSSVQTDIPSIMK